DDNSRPGAVAAVGRGRAHAGNRVRHVALEAVGLGGLGVAGVIHAVKSDAMAALAGDGEGAAVEGGAGAVHAVVRLGDAASGVAGGHGHSHRAAGIPAVVAHGAGEAVRGRRGHAVDPEAVGPVAFRVTGVIHAGEGDAVATFAEDGEGAAVEG